MVPPAGMGLRLRIAWLRELDAINAMPVDDWQERSRLLAAMGADRSGSADPVRDQLRQAVANGAADATAEVDGYLATLLEGGARGGAEFVDSPGLISTVLSARFVDLVVSTMVMRDDPDSPLDYAVEQSDGIRDQGHFFPASPVRAGCDLLFAADEYQAVRLLEALSAAAASEWRRREAGRGLTAHPLVIDHADGAATLWGDQYVYRWARGLLGSRLLGSLLLAADDWFAAQIAAGRPLNELCAKLLRHSHLVASASICVAEAMNGGVSGMKLRRALPLLVHPRLSDALVWRIECVPYSRLSRPIHRQGIHGGWRTSSRHSPAGARTLSGCLAWRFDVDWFRTRIGPRLSGPFARPSG